MILHRPNPPPNCWGIRIFDLNPIGTRPRALLSVLWGYWEGQGSAGIILDTNASAAALGGCANKPDFARVQAIEQARAAADDAKCQSYGAKPGEPAYIQCRVALDNQRAQMRATVAGALVASRRSRCRDQR